VLHEVDSRAVGKVGRGRRGENHQVGPRADAQVTDVLLPQRFCPTQRRRKHGLETQASAKAAPATEETGEKKTKKSTKKAKS